MISGSFFLLTGLNDLIVGLICMEVNIRPPLFDKDFWKNYFTVQTFSCFLDQADGNIDIAIDKAEEAAERLSNRILVKMKQNDSTFI